MASTRFSLTTVFLMYSLLSFGQIKKGTSAIGGNVGFSFQTDPNLSRFNFTLAPDLLFFVAKDFAIGPKIGYAVTTRKPKAVNTTDVSQAFFLGPVLRHYFKLSQMVYLYSGASAYYTTGKMTQLQSASDLSQVYNGVGWEVGPGLSVFPSKNVAIEIGPQYRGSYITNAIKNNKVVIGNQSSIVTHGVFFEVGFRYFFEKADKESKPK
jgi:opacity protein-like surface antigen